MLPSLGHFDSSKRNSYSTGRNFTKIFIILTKYEDHKLHRIALNMTQFLAICRSLKEILPNLIQIYPILDQIDLLSVTNMTTFIGHLQNNLPSGISDVKSVFGVYVSYLSAVVGHLTFITY